MPNPGTKLVKRTERVQGVGREEFDKVVKTFILDSVRMIGDDYLDLFLSFIQRRNGMRTLDLQDVDAALDSIFMRFSILVKHVIMFQICAALKLEPQKLLKSLEWISAGSKEDWAQELGVANQALWKHVRTTLASLRP